MSDLVLFIAKRIERKGNEERDEFQTPRSHQPEQGLTEAETRDLS